MTEAEGYWYGSDDGRGITMFEIRPPQTTSKDEIAFGFMTWAESGTLLRVDGDRSSGHFIDAQLVFIYLFMAALILEEILMLNNLFSDCRYVP